MHRERLVTLDFEPSDETAPGETAILTDYRVKLRQVPSGAMVPSCVLDRLQWPFRAQAIVLPLEGDPFLPWDDWWLESFVIADDEQLVVPCPLSPLVGATLVIAPGAPGVKIALVLRNRGTVPRRIRLSLRGAALE